MAEFHTKHRVSYSAQQMYDLVADVEQYPQFLPLCSDLRVFERTEHDSGEILKAHMTIAYKMFRESFTSEVKLSPQQKTISVRYLEGPFRKLDNQWRFVDLEPGESSAQKGCEIDFYIDYEFRAKPLQFVMGGVFDKAFRKFTAAFENRARQIYGAG